MQGKQRNKVKHFDLSFLLLHKSSIEQDSRNMLLRMYPSLDQNVSSLEQFIWKHGKLFSKHFPPLSTLVKMRNFNTVLNSLMNNSKIIWVHIWRIIHLQYNVFWILFGPHSLLIPYNQFLILFFFFFEYFEDFMLYYFPFLFLFLIFSFCLLIPTQKFMQGKFKHTQQIQHSYIYIYVI